MSDLNGKYHVTIGLNVLNRVELNLLGNTLAVFAEVIANSWDANVTEMNILFDIEKRTSTVKDNDRGMSYEDINNKYLYIGYQ